MGYPRIDGLGQIVLPLEVVRIDGDLRLVVTPWGAIGTDALLVATGSALFFAAGPPLLKILGALGGAWGLLAIGVEVAKLARPAHPRLQLVTVP